MGVTCSEPIYHESDDEEQSVMGDGGCNVLRFSNTSKSRTRRYYSNRQLDDTYRTPARATHPTAELLFRRDFYHPRDSGGCIVPFECATRDIEDEELVSGSNYVQKDYHDNNDHSPTTVMEFPVSMELVLLEIISRHLSRRPYEDITEYLVPLHLIQQAAENSTHKAKGGIECDATLKMRNVKKIMDNDSMNGSSFSSDPDNPSFLRHDNSWSGSHFYQISLKCMFIESYEAFLERYPQYKHQTGLYDRESFPDPTQFNNVSRETDFAYAIACEPIPRLVLMTGNHSSFLDLDVSGSLGLFCKGSSSRSRRSFLTVSNRTTGEPLTISAFHQQGTEVRVRMFATRPRAVGQLAACTTRDLGIHHHGQFKLNENSPKNSQEKSLPLFQWADIVSEDVKFPNDGARFHTFMATGHRPGQVDEIPKYVATYATTGSPELVIFTRSLENSNDSDGPLEPCAVVMLKNTRDEYDRNHRLRKSADISSEISNQLGISFVMSIANGIDPVMIISMTAVIEEITGYLIQRTLLS